MTRVTRCGLSFARTLLMSRAFLKYPTMFKGMAPLRRHAAHGLEAAQVRPDQQRAPALLLERSQVLGALLVTSKSLAAAQRPEQAIQRDVREPHTRAATTARKSWGWPRRRR